MNPSYLSTLVLFGANMTHYMPPVKATWQRYLSKFSKNGKLLESLDPLCGLIEVDEAEVPF